MLYAVLSAFTSMPAFSLATNKASVCVFSSCYIRRNASEDVYFIFNFYTFVEMQ